MPWASPPGSARPALAAAAGVLLAVLATIALGLDFPWWAALGAWNAAGPDRAAVAAQAPRVVIGALGGAMAAVALAAATAGVLPLQVLAIVAAGTVGLVRRFAGGADALGWAFATLTVLLVLLENALVPTEGIVAYAAMRIGEITCGAGAAAVVAVLALPRRAGDAPAVPAPRPAAMPVGLAALIGGALVPAVALLWSGLGLPDALLTAVLAGFAFDRDLIVLRRGVAGRLLGCAAGGLYAPAVLPLGLDSLPVWGVALGGGFGVVLLGAGLDGFPPWAAALGGGVYLFSRLALSPGPASYFGIHGGWR